MLWAGFVVRHVSAVSAGQKTPLTWLTTDRSRTGCATGLTVFLKKAGRLVRKRATAGR